MASSGNYANELNPVIYPAAYDHVISVAAVDESRRVAGFSTHNTAVDIAAPGVDVLSLGSSIGNQSLGSFGPGYIVLSGTSMAAPHVAGVAALLWSQFPDKNVTEIEEALTLSAHDLGSCDKDPLTGHGLVDAIAAAMYLEGDADIVPQNRSCILVNVSLTTDDFGSETMYFVTSDDDSSDIFYRGGPYVEGQRATYFDTFTLPDGCYNLFWGDTYGDGNNNTNYGIGEITLDYGGTLQVASDALNGRFEAFRFGSCDDTTPTPTAAPTTAPVLLAPVVTSPFPDPCTRQVPTVTCNTAAGESLLQVSLSTDSWSSIKNHLYLYDIFKPDDEFIWKVPLGQLADDSHYEGEACLQDLGAQNCFEFYFLDELGNGFYDGGKLTLSLDGVVVFEISPGDPGDPYDAWSSVTYWYQEFGSACWTPSNFNRAF